MLYHPHLESSRKHLATVLLRSLREKGFIEEWHGDAGDPTRERVFYFPYLPDPKIRVVIYTSIVDGEVRPEGKDAIRVLALYRTSDGRDRCLARETRVNRTGDTDEIVRRTLERAREVYRKVSATSRCSCGAPFFKSKKGNMVCADFCWKP